MIEDIIGINEITFNVSDDALNFQTIFTIGWPLLEIALNNNKTLFSIVNTIFKSANQSLNSKKKYYQLNIIFTDKNICLTYSAGKNSLSSYVENVKGVSEKSIAYKNFFSLTKREREIFHMISNKCKQATIISTLGFSLNTFKTHKKNIYYKMSFKGRDDLLEWAKLHADIIK